jgi:hypothetical protein
MGERERGRGSGRRRGGGGGGGGGWGVAGYDDDDGDDDDEDDDGHGGGGGGGDPDGALWAGGPTVAARPMRLQAGPHTTRIFNVFQLNLRTFEVPHGITQVVSTD